MTSLASSPLEPNAPIFLEDINITHINGHRLGEPCRGRVVLRLSPTIMPRIESDSLPIGILDSSLEMPFVITTTAGCCIEVVLLTISPGPGSAKGTIKGALGPYKSPCVVMDSDAQVKSVTFCVLNFSQFYGQKDKCVNWRNTSLILGATELGFGDWRVSITQDPGLSENRKLLAEAGGYAVTHTGLIERSGGQTFSVNEAESLLRVLRAFLSFARGSGCGLTLVKAIDGGGRKTIMEWGTQHVETWKNAKDTWLPTTDGGDILSQLFPGFWKLCGDPDWKDTLFTAIDWYLNSNDGPFHVGIILVQAALESLCYKITGPNKERGKGRTGRYLSKSVRQFGLCAKIPSACTHLQNAFGGLDGPAAIAEIRNDLVHAKKTHSNDAAVQMDALRLGQWYIEMILLKQLNYRGRYVNRLTPSGENPFESVPWETSV